MWTELLALVRLLATGMSPEPALMSCATILLCSGPVGLLACCAVVLSGRWSVVQWSCWADGLLCSGPVGPMGCWPFLWGEGDFLQLIGSRVNSYNVGFYHRVIVIILGMKRVVKGNVDANAVSHHLARKRTAMRDQQCPFWMI